MIIIIIIVLIITLIALIKIKIIIIRIILMDRTWFHKLILMANTIPRTHSYMELHFPTAAMMTN